MAVTVVPKIVGSVGYDPTAVAITGGTGQWDDGTKGAPSIAFAAQPTTGIFRPGSAVIGFSLNNNYNASISGGGITVGSSSVIGWNSGSQLDSGSIDTTFVRQAAAVLQMYGSSTAVGASLRRIGGNAGYVQWGSVAENLTLSTSGTTTDTAADLLPADSYIEAVTARVTTTITTATDWKLGDATTSGRFTAAQSGGQLTAGATVVGLVHCDVTGAGGPRQTAAAKVRVTTTGTPGAGAIRITSYFRTFVAPTS